MQYTRTIKREHFWAAETIQKAENHNLLAADNDTISGILCAKMIIKN